MKKAWDKLLLIGFRGSGKTTIGKLLADRLNLSFLDLDEEIQRRVGLSIKEMVERFGWGYFREREREVLAELINLKKCVVALGGGSVLHRDLMEKLKEGSLMVYLKVSAETAIQRIALDEKTKNFRPSLSDLPFAEEVKRLLEERSPIYESFADIIINGEKDVGALLQEILQEILKKTTEEVSRG